jgi:Ca-activated chloride channel family protein
MSRIRAAQLRFYPTFVTLVLLAQRALALECSAVDQQGQPAPEGALVETEQAIELTIQHQVAAAHVRYRFHNRGAVALELTCELRLAPGEMVDGFSYWNGSEQVVGEVLERAAASEVYEELANVQRRDPGLLEQEGELFRFRVFPVAPGEHKAVELRSVTALPMRDGRVQYTVLRGNLPRAGGVSLRAQIGDALAIDDVELLGAQAKIERLGAVGARVAASFSASPAAGARDLQLRYRVRSDDYALRLASHRAPGEDGTFMLIVSPKDAVGSADVLGRDIVFVTDISGSMQGAPLEQAKLGLLDMLEQLGDHDRFEVVSFDDESYPMFGELVGNDAAIRAQAAARVTQLETRGGTNIHGALLRALDLLRDVQPGRARAIVLLTDGQGEHPPELIAQAVRERGRGARIYSFGVGDGVDRGFLTRLAEENRGVAAFVSDQAAIHGEMKRLYERIAMPVMMDLTLDIEGGDVHSVHPRQLPDLYRDGEVIVLGRYRRAGDVTLRVRGRLAGGERDLELRTQLPELHDAAPQLEKLWASRRVQHLLGIAGTREQDAELTQEITRLGVVYNLVTPHTAFLAVPASLQTAQVKEQMRRGRLGYDKKLIDSMQGIRLSQSAIPPGDPVLTVDAPEEALQVVAYFPFGLVKRLAWDERRKHWSVRFLVPRDVQDGKYPIRVRITRADGTLEWKEIEIEIDGSEPELDVVADEFAIPGVRFHLEVDPHEPVRELYAYLPGVSKRRVRLALDRDSGRYRGALPIPERFEAEELTIRIVARDRARNRVEHELQVPVLSELDCCHDQETCGLIPSEPREAVTFAAASCPTCSQ